MKENIYVKRKTCYTLCGF